VVPAAGQSLGIIRGMNNLPIRSLMLWIIAAAIVVVAYHQYGWMGLALALGGMVMWALLHVTRLITVMKRAARAPVGYVDSAVMLNAKLRKGVNLLHVIAVTRSLGLQQSDKDTQPEVYRWTDSGGSHTTLTFMDGKLMEWVLWRPETAAHQASPKQSVSP
jgi:hypothetical protein